MPLDVPPLWTPPKPAIIRSASIAEVSRAAIAAQASPARRLALFTPGLMIPRAVSYTSTLISRTAGSAIGDLAGTGGLPAIFDGTTSQSSGAAASKSTSTFAYFGRTLAAAKRIDKVVFYGSSDVGLYHAGDPSITADLYGKAGSAPANSTDGVLLGTTTFTDASAGTARTVTNTGIDYTLYDHWFVRISSGVSATFWSVAEAEAYEWA